MQKLEWHTEKRRIKILLPYKHNPRQMTQDQADQLRRSIEKFNFVEIPVIDIDNTIIAGHQRLRIMKILGRGDEEIDVRVPNRKLTDEELQEYNIRSNKNTGEWDWDMLNNLDLDLLKDIGFSEVELSKEFDKLTDPEEDDFDATLPEKAESKLGEVYILGRHRLMCGDSTKKADVEKLMDGKKADMVFTDPPYGIDVVKNKQIGGGGKLGFVGATGSAKARQYREIINDKTTETAEKFYLLCKQLGYENYIIWGGQYFTKFLPTSGCWIVWDKKETDIKNTFSDCELAWTSIDGKTYLYRHLWAGLLRKGNRDIELKERVHPTQKPVGLCGNILKDFTKQDDIVLDLFGGSGSTLIAAEQTNRICYMMELDPKYCDVIRDRYKKFTSNINP